ncbi:MAG: thioredoxin domain-containing protein [Flavobacteriales bacterium]
MMTASNSLIHESSPYLQQHAHHPIDWMPWSEAAFDLAKRQNKLVLISIGYSACHWCHVMAHESFEDQEVADLMNAHFINIKVDREERPDVDQVYMSAVQLMTQRGGWPLNCITLPDGRPIYGGTYFPKDQWIHVLKSLVYTFQNDVNKVEEYATKLHEGLQVNELISIPQEEPNLASEKLIELVARWKKQFDWMEGGMNRAPKFPMPNNYSYLLAHSQYFKDEKIKEFLSLTLNKMAHGGIYDQIGGGFMRYSVDMLWKVPHFEKMLYDNAQLIGLYAEAFELFNKEEYQQIVLGIFSWLQREMKDESGAFYSALDADSEGEEGKFYCWNELELKELIGADFSIFADYYSVNNRGFWEEDKFILLKTQTDASFAEKWHLSLTDLDQKVSLWKFILLSERQKRIRPGLDHKCLTSWNAQLIQGLCQAFRVFQQEEFILEARKIGKWILAHQCQTNGQLFHVNTNGLAGVTGFLEDYAHAIAAFLQLYQQTGEWLWLEHAKIWTNIVEEEFMHADSKMCYFTSADSELVVRKMELHDNVIPASNSVMARNFFRMGTYFREERWLNNARQMLANMYDGMETYGSGYSNWAHLLLEMNQGIIEVHLMNQQSTEKIKWPQHVLISHHQELPMSSNYGYGIYVCAKGTCYPKLSNLKAARQLIEEELI